MYFGRLVRVARLPRATRGLGDACSLHTSLAMVTSSHGEEFVVLGIRRELGHSSTADKRKILDVAAHCAMLSEILKYCRVYL